jgi:1-acyl-sn-glycerol-3-phosphate acyltransferase
MRAVGHIPVNRSHPEKAIASIQRGTQKLRKHGDQVVFFPEGTRTRNGQLLPFKKGAFVFAIESQLPLVPFAIEGSFRALPPGQRCLHSGMIRVQFLPPVDTTGLTRDDRDPLMQSTARQIGTALESLNTAEADYQRLGR